MKYAVWLRESILEYTEIEAQDEKDLFRKICMDENTSAIIPIAGRDAISRCDIYYAPLAMLQLPNESDFLVDDEWMDFKSFDIAVDSAEKKAQAKFIRITPILTHRVEVFAALGATPVATIEIADCEES